MKSRPIELFIRYRSTTGIIALCFLLYFSTPSAESITAGFFLMSAGMFFRGWAAGYLSKNNTLATAGPYSLTSHPLYFGNFIIGTGIATAGNNYITFAIFLTYFLMFFPFLMVIEHRRLQEQFGETYTEWKKGSRSFFPRFKIKKSHIHFNVSFYMKNREYRVIYFSLFIIAIIILKYIKIIKAL